MTLLNAPEFDERKETRTRNILIASASTVVLLAVIAFLGFVLGHGWFFINLPAEHRVKTLLSDVQAGNYPAAYAIWNNDPDWQQHLSQQRYQDYPLKRFQEDFSTASNWKGSVTSFHVDFSKRDDSGVVVASTVNGQNLTLKVQKADKTIDFFPYELTRGLF